MNQNWNQETAPDGCREGNTPDENLTERAPQRDLTPTEENCETSTRYQNLDWHAAGGLGVIYRARDVDLRRDVALKFIRDISLGGSASVGTFENEAKITAQLGHPGVVPIYGIGKTQDDARPFYAMRFIEGRKLSQVISDFHTADRSKRLDAQSAEFRKLLTRMVFVCSTIQYAHHRGVIHLDIKPDNVMVGQFDETLVVDWGLAAKVARDEMRQHPIFKSIDSNMSELDSIGPKSTGEGPGTPAYFSPEQARQNCELTFATDIYLLGATLYHILTGTAPLADATSRSEVFIRAREGDFPKPSDVRPGIPRELEEICLKAMRKNPRERYATAREIGQDIENFLSDAPVSVHQDRWWEKAFRWSRHHRNLTRSIATFVVVLGFLFGLFSVYKSSVADHERTMRTSTLRVAGTFAAKGLAEEINNRWLILGNAAADPQLTLLLDELDQVAKVEDGRLNLTTEPALGIVKKLDVWLKRKDEKSHDRTNAANWYLFNSKGYLIGRSPHGSNYFKILGRNFAYRSHFHGQEEDGTDKAKAFLEASPVEQPYLSSAFVSTGDNRVKIAFSSPVRRSKSGGEADDEHSRPIAVLGMNVEPGKFQFLNLSDEDDDLEAVLVDTKIANLGKEEPPPTVAHDFRGLVLHHPRLDGELIGFSEDYIHNRFEKLLTSASSKSVTSMIVSDHMDPIEPASTGPRLAIYEPVLFENDQIREGHGLIVIIQERKIYKGK